MRLEVIENGKLVPKSEQRAVLIAMTERLNANLLRRKLERTQKRHERAPERQSFAIAMLAVEERLVKALWVIARQPAKGLAPGSSNRCGVDYLHERTDVYARYLDPMAGKWDRPPPRPPIPSGQDIDEAKQVQDWLLLVDEDLRKILLLGAASKRGDAGRNINWRRIADGRPEFRGMSSRTLGGRYRDALRTIVWALTFKAAA